MTTDAEKIAERLATALLAAGLREWVDAWEAYTAYLREKYPAPEGEPWAFTCPHHRRMSAALAALKGETDD
jgi:hypothetical protein